MANPRVPLTRPSFPQSDDFYLRWKHVTNMTGQHSNRGTLWHEAARRLENFTEGRYVAFPVANGTDAVALAIYGASREQSLSCYNGAVNVEGFTFHATLCAAKMVAGHDVTIIDTNERVDPTEIAVRTKWWGYDRDLLWCGANDVIDAAGGFGDASAFEHIGKDCIVAVSFHATKNFPIGEGGAVLVPKHREMAQLAVHRAMSFGFDIDRKPVEPFGINAKLDELRCSLLIEQLEHAKHFERRADNMRALVIHVATHAYGAGKSDGKEMQSKDGIDFPQLGNWPSLPVFPMPRADELVAFMAERGFQCRRTYDPIPGANYEPWQRSCVAFPADMTADENRQLCAALDEFYGKTEIHHHGNAN